MHILLHSLPPTLQQATTNPRVHWRLLDTPGQVWGSLLWGHCSFLLGPREHKVLFVPPRVYFPVLYRFWQLCGGVNGDLLQEGLGHTLMHPEPLALRQATAAPYRRYRLPHTVCLSLCGAPGSWCLSVSGRNVV